MSPLPLTIVITGANRGIGLALLNSLLSSPPSLPLNLHACARSIPSSPPTTTSSSISLTWHALTLTSPPSIASLASSLSASPHGVDVLVNNAGVNLDGTEGSAAEIAARTLDVNYRGTLALTKALLPLMNGPPAGDLDRRRVVILSSVGCRNVSSQQRRRLSKCASLAEIDAMADEYLQSVKNDTVTSDGWPLAKSYSVSKALLNAAVGVLAAEHPHLYVNACCPGWCDTDMGRLTGRPGKTAAEGARVPRHLAVGDVDGLSGMYWENESPFGKGVGRAVDWTE